MERPTRKTSLAFAAGGLLLVAGGGMHPHPDTSLSFKASTAGMLAGAQWLPAHLLSLAGLAFLLAAMIGLARSRPGDRLVRAVAAAAGLGVVEMAFHAAAKANQTALATGGSTPLVNAHLGIALVAYPLLGLGIAALAWRGRSSLANPAMSVLGAAGGIGYALSAPIVVLSQNQRFSFLFVFGIPMALWGVGVAVRGLRAKAAAPETVAA